MSDKWQTELQSSASLKFLHGVVDVVVKVNDQDGLNHPLQVFNVGRVVLARGGENGELQLDDGKTLVGEVTYRVYNDVPSSIPTAEQVEQACEALKGLKNATLEMAPGVLRMADLDESVVSVDHSVPGGFAAQVLELVAKRGEHYGTPAENHQLTAELWTAWLQRRFGNNVDLSAEDVCALNVIQKMSRLAYGTKDDSWLDVAGYTENVGMLHPSQRNGGGK